MHGGNVGVGTTTPGGLLSPGTGLVAKKLAIYDGASDFYGLSIQAGRMVVYTGNTEQMTVTNGGNVGIGTTSPTNALEVNGTIATTPSGGIWLNSARTSGMGDFGGGTINFRVGNNDSRVVINSDGNVGIGTTAPIGSLDVGNGSGTSYLVVSATTRPGKVLGSSTTVNANVPQASSAKVCYVNVTTRAGQNVMIYGQASWTNNGTTTPTGSDTAMWLTRGGVQITPNKSATTVMWTTTHTQSWVETPGAGTFEYAVYGQELSNRTAPTSTTCFIQVTSLN